MKHNYFICEQDKIDAPISDPLKYMHIYLKMNKTCLWNPMPWQQIKTEKLFLA